MARTRERYAAIHELLQAGRSLVAEPRHGSMCQRSSTKPAAMSAFSRLGAAVQQSRRQAVRRCRPAGRTDPRGSGGDLGEKEAVLAAQPGAFFTIPHLDGYPAVLIPLKNVSRAALREAIIDGWLACTPTRLVDQYLGR
jgi:hypothetical protein